MRDFYVDNLATGCYNIDEAFQIKNELDSLMKKGGMELQEWASNKMAISSKSETPNNN